MTAEAIMNVSRALKQHLKAALEAAKRPSEVPGEVYVGPLDTEEAKAAAMVLFLYRIVPNPQLRNTERRLAPMQPGEPVIVHHEALPLDLYYLLTVDSRDAAGESEPLRILGIALQAMQSTPNLVGMAVGPDPVRLSLEAVTSEEMSRIWALFPNLNYRTSLVYLATPVWVDPLALKQPAPAVLDDNRSVGQRAL